MACKKCESEAVVTSWIPSGQCVNTSSLQPVKNEFLYSIEYDLFWKVKAAKEHLKKSCNACGYQWRENTKDQ